MPASKVNRRRSWEQRLPMCYSAQHRVLALHVRLSRPEGQKCHGRVAVSSGGEDRANARWRNPGHPGGEEYSPGRDTPDLLHGLLNTGRVRCEGLLVALQMPKFAGSWPARDCACSFGLLAAAALARQA
jgi:hypothetical protein